MPDLPSFKMPAARGRGTTRYRGRRGGSARVAVRFREGAVREQISRVMASARPSHEDLGLPVRRSLKSLHDDFGVVRTSSAVSVPGGRRSVPFHVDEGLSMSLEHLVADLPTDVDALPEQSAIDALAEVGLSVAAAPDPSLAGLNLLEVEDPRSAARLARALDSEASVEYAEVIPQRWLAAAPSPARNRQWGLRAARWFEAAPVTAKGIRIGVIDSGADAEHPDLKGRISTVHGPAPKTDESGHGTHVCGIVAAASNDETGVAGVVEGVELEVWKVVGNEGDGAAAEIDPDSYVKALGAALTSGVRVVNLSIAGDVHSESEERLMEALIRAGIVVVAAGGNNHLDGNPICYPAAHPGVIAVGSADEAERRSAFSSTGSYIDLLAPGSNVLSTLPRRRAGAREERMYGVMSGSSMAAPMVSGVAAALVARGADWTPARIKEHFHRTARRPPEMKGRTRTDAHGTGMLDIAAALSS